MKLVGVKGVEDKHGLNGNKYIAVATPKREKPK